MSGAQASLAISVFLACAVEAVEALTIVLAVGSTRGWRAALLGTAAAILVLALLVAILGPALTVLPFNVLRLRAPPARPPPLLLFLFVVWGVVGGLFFFLLGGGGAGKGSPPRRRRQG